MGRSQAKRNPAFKDLHAVFEKVVCSPATSLIDWLSMVLRLRQHNISYTADGFYRSDDSTNSVKALKEGG